MEQLLFVVLLVLVNVVLSQKCSLPPSLSQSLLEKNLAKLRTKGDYYAGIDFAATDNTMKQQLHDLINPHYVCDYDEVWTAFMSVDHYLNHYPCNADNNSYIPDVYSSYCWDPEKLTTSGGECGNYKKEGDCYNREHLWPKSWFGGFDYGKNAQTDLFELWPTDGYVNGMRGDLPFGVVTLSNVSYKSSNGCLIGRCEESTNYAGKCFEPPDEYKGDFARSYFYVSTAYYNEWDCCETEGTNKSSINAWMEAILRQWHVSDPVDETERQRNDVIYSDWQRNRNPFIDYPEFVDQISDF